MKTAAVILRESTEPDAYYATCLAVGYTPLRDAIEGCRWLVHAKTAGATNLMNAIVPPEERCEL